MEDDPILAEVLRGHLHDMNFEVEVASASRDALSQLPRGRRYDAAMLDAPGDANGLELAHELRGLRPELPILLLGGYTSQVERALRDGFVLLQKPYEAQQLRRALGEALLKAGVDR